MVQRREQMVQRRESVLWGHHILRCYGDLPRDSDPPEEKRKSGAEKRKSGAEKRKSGAEKRNCTLGPPYIATGLGAG